MFIDFENTSEFLALCGHEDLGADEWLFICLARSEEDKLDSLREGLSEKGVRFFGGIFPALIDDAAICERGAIVQRVKLIAPAIAAQIDGSAPVLGTPLPDLSDYSERPTCLVVSDFSCVAITLLLEELFDKYGNDLNYFGAGAGNGNRQPSPVLFSNDGLFTGASLIAFISTGSQVELRHGWSRNSEPVIATRTELNVVKELNWEPAMKVYRELVGEQVANSLLRQEDVPEAKRYPFGIAREDLEDVVRDPISATEDDALVVLSGIPENSTMHVLKADNDKLVEAAGQLGTAFDAQDDARICLLFDCFSRARLLANDFPRELEAFVEAFRKQQPDCRIEGALALGEISSDGNRFPDFHNKTIAAGMFYAD